MSGNANDRRVFISMPGYGELTAGAAKGFWRATRLPESAVRYQYNEGSLLAANFNTLWCSALNQVHHGERVDYFAMQHADVEPQDWWLDTLIDELEENDLDVLGVAVPIKDTKGLTSIALGRPDRDTWRVQCRLTMTELYRLPETFTSDDVGHPLLLNTGLWVCRFGEWARKVRFTINDRIAFDTKLDRYVQQTEPEDWYFSRLCHELGLKIGCTRKIGLTHRGPMAFTNQRVWGSDSFDTGYLSASVVPEVDRDGFRWPADVPGWLKYGEGKALFDLCRGKRVLEIGSYLGLSTICIAQTAEHVVSVDPHDGRGTQNPYETHDAFLSFLEKYGVAEKVESIVGLTADAPSGPFDVVFIDGAHDFESVRADIEHAIERLAPEGVIAFHDYRSDVDPGVTAAVDEFLGAGGELLALHGTLAVVKPPALVPA